MLAQTQAARALGWSVFALPEHLREYPEQLEAALAKIPKQTTPVRALWVGFVPTVVLYERVYQAAAARNIGLLNTPAQHALAMELDRAYEAIADLTPATCAVQSIADVDAAVARLGLPVFVKGAMASLKERGWEACVAPSAEAARALVAQLLPMSVHSRGRVLLRALAPLRHHRVEASDFRIGREYRVFVLEGNVVGLGYYWPYMSDFMDLTPFEDDAVRKLALKCATRLDVPYLSVDIGQLESGEWIVIETGDPQFAGLSFISVEALWNALHEKLT